MDPCLLVEDQEYSEFYSDVGLLSVCYEYVLLPLVIKEAVSANGLVE